MTLFGIDRPELSAMSPRQAVEAFRDLLFASARKQALPVERVSISLDLNVADGGIDASILGGSAIKHCNGILSTANRFQIKTGSPTPWQESWVRKELFGDKIPYVAHSLGAAVRRCLREGGQYVLVCFGIDPNDEQIRASRDNFNDAFRKCGFDKCESEVWGQTQLKGSSVDLQFSGSEGRSH